MIIGVILATITTMSQNEKWSPSFARTETGQKILGLFKRKTCSICQQEVPIFSVKPDTEEAFCQQCCAEKIWNNYQSTEAWRLTKRKSSDEKKP